MRLQSWHVHGFGHFVDQRVEGLSPGLTLFYGPNEAGKSTLLAFLMAALFGPPRSKQERLPALNGGRHAGLVRFEHEGHEWALERDFAGNKLLLQGPHGSSTDLGQVLRGVDLPTFQAVFAFNLQGLGALAALDEEALRDRLFTGSLVGGGESLTGAMARLKQQQEKLWKPRGDCAWRQLDEQREGLRKRIQTGRLLLPDYVEATLKAQEAQAQAEGLKAAWQANQEAQQRLQLRLQLWPQHLRAEQAQAELAESPAIPEAFESWQERVEPLAATLAQLERRLAELQADQDALAAKAAALTLEPSWEAQGPAIRRLAGREGGAHAAWQRAQSKAQDLQARRQAHEANLRAISPEWATKPPSLADWGLPQAETLRAARAAWQESQARLKAHAQRGQDLQQQLKALQSPPPSADAGQGLPDEATWAALEALRRSWATAQTQATTLAEQLAAAERAPQAPSGAGLPAWPFWLAFVVFALGAVACFMLQQWVGLGLALLAAVACLLLALRGAPGGAAGPDLAPLREGLAKAKAQLAELTQAWQAQGQPWALGSEPSDGAWEALRLKREAALRAQLQAQESQAQRQAQAAALAQAQAEVQAQSAPLAAEAEAATQAWGAALARWALPSLHSPEGLDELLRRLDQAKEAELALAQGAAALAQDEAEWQGFAAELAALAQALGESPGEGPDAWPSLLAGWAQRGEAAQQAHQEAQSLQDQRQALWSQAQKLRAEREAQAQGLAEACAALGLAGPECLGELRQRVAKARELAATLDAWTRSLDEHLGRGEAREAMLASFQGADPSAWEAERTRLALEATELEHQRGALQQAAGAAQERAKQCLGNEELHALELELAGVEAEQQELVAQWEALGLARALLDETLKRFERERQPAVLKATSALFAEVTRGVYPRVFVRERGLMVVDAQGGERAATQLSQGTREQLYLCLRLALSESLAQAGQAFPFVMDDVLVNFDAERAEDVARVLLRAAQSQQILLFTCQSATVALFRRLAPEVVVKELPRYAGRPHPAVPPLAARALPDEAPSGLELPRGEAQPPSEALGQVLALLQAEGRPMGKAAILEACGLDEGLWGQVAQQLMDTEGVLVAGEKRGRTYAWKASEAVLQA